jgi:hypothetical protein
MLITMFIGVGFLAVSVESFTAAAVLFGAAAVSAFYV